MTLKEKLLKRLPKKYWNRVETIEEENDLVDDCKYMLYYTDEFTNGDCAGSSYPVKSITEAIDFIKNSLFPLTIRKKEDLVKSLIDLSNKLESGEFDHFDLRINHMSIFNCTRIKFIGNNETLYINPEKGTELVIGLENIEYLRVYATISKNRKLKLVINYRA